MRLRPRIAGDYSSNHDGRRHHDLGARCLYAGRMTWVPILGVTRDRPRPGGTATRHRSARTARPGDAVRAVADCEDRIVRAELFAMDLERWRVRGIGQAASRC